MQTGYFATAWNDIRNSPGWVGKMFLLALINLIPIFGQIVTVGYLYGWARDAAWGIQSPLPKHIFGNEDGKLYSRGFFILVLGLVFALVIGVLSFIIFIPFMGAIVAFASGDVSSIGAAGIFLFIGFILAALLFVVALAASFFIWVGEMRISIYGRLSAGFQLKKISKMLRKDFVGILKIFGMVLILSFIAGILMQIIIAVFGLFFGVSSAGMFSSYYNGSGYSYGTSAALGIGVSLVMLVLFYLEMVVMMWVSTMNVRALGYWTCQFDVPSWRGQDDPLPFELQQVQSAPQSGAQYYQQTSPENQSYAQPHQGVSVQPYSHTQAPTQTVPITQTASATDSKAPVSDGFAESAGETESGSDVSQAPGENKS